MTHPLYPHLLEPITLGAGPDALTLRNRVVMGSMHTGLEDHPWDIDKLAAFFEERARGGVGLIITGGYAPTKRGWLKPFASEMTNRLHAKRHERITGAVHDAGGAIALQVLHAGRYGYHPLSQSASDKKSPITPFKPSAMSSKEVDHTATAFAKSVALARKAGYDAVEIMGSEGYLINQFLAARTNDRDDQWGGSPARRMHFAVEVVRRSRELVGPDFPIVYRISLLDLVEGGQTWEETAEPRPAPAGRRRHRLQHRHRLARGAGADDHHAGAARRLALPHRAPQGGRRRPGLRVQPDQHPRARRGHPGRQRGRPRLDGATAAGRPGLRREGDGRARRRDQHLHRLQPGLPRPRLQQRARLLPGQPPRLPRDRAVLMPTLRKQTVAVVGAGPAGLAAATSAAERGFAVTLFEKSPEVGGQFRLAMAVPGKEDFADTLRYFTRRLEVLGVDVRLATAATADDLAGFDQVVVATGVTPRLPEIPGIDHPSVASYADVLSGAVVPGKRVAVVGAGGIGVDVSVFLTHEEEDLDDWMAHWGVGDPALHEGGLTEAKPRTPAREVTLVQRKTTPIGIGLGKTSGWAHRAVLKQSRVTLVSGATYDRIDDAGLHVTVDGATRVIEADTIVVCAGQDSVRDLYDGLGREAHLIGGADVAAEALDAKRAIKQGTEVVAGL